MLQGLVMWLEVVAFNSLETSKVSAKAKNKGITFEKAPAAKNTPVKV